jgi:DHA3 family tetracycline resistance protein-like MFS transporter
MALFRALRHPRFALLLFGQTLSRLGDFVFQLALAWWVLEKTGSALVMGTVLIFALVPSILFGLAGGVAGDRFPRVAILLLSDVGRAVIMAAIALLAASGRLELWMVYGLNLLFSFADAFFQPAFMAIVPEITPADDLTSANALSSLSMQFARMVGPALGGALMAVGGTGVAFGFNAVSFFSSGLLLLPLLRTSRRPQPAGEASPTTPVSVFADLRAGWDVVIAQPILWVSILSYGFANILLAGPFSIGLPFLVKDVLGGDERMLGLLLASFPLGYALSSAYLGNVSHFRWRGLMIYLALTGAGFGLGVFSLPLPVWVLFAAGMVNGAALEIGNMAWINTLQTLVPIDKLGRVSSLDNLGSFVLLPAGYALTGFAVEGWGAAPTFLVFCGTCVVLSLIPLCWTPIRMFD